MEPAPAGDRNTAAPLSSLIGAHISHFEVLEKLGQGGMGVVYKARDTQLGRLVALKLLMPEAVADPERKKRFVQEARTASALNHPNIITIYEIDRAGPESASTDFIAMEYVQGQPLNRLIAGRGLQVRELLKYAVQIADALTVAHAAGIIHRDLKPANVMVTGPQSARPGLVKVLDFGLAKLTERAEGDPAAPTVTAGDAPFTKHGAILGTVAYMSPEQAEGGTLDPRSDIFSFGTVLYEMLTGRQPFSRPSTAATLAAVLREQPAPPGELAPGVAVDLEKVITRCLRKEPERRFQHMDDIKVALDELQEESAPSVTTTAPATPRSSFLRRPAVWGAALPAVALAGVLAWLLLRPSPPAPAAVNPVPLTSYAGSEIHPSFSPDGNQLAFSWNGEKQDNYDIYVKLVGPGKPLQLTQDLADDVGPAWSPDGRWIAFVRGRPGRKAGVFIVPALGGAQRKIGETRIAGFDHGPYLTWSPVARFLVVGDTEAPMGLVVLAVDSGEKAGSPPRWWTSRRPSPPTAAPWRSPAPPPRAARFTCCRCRTAWSRKENPSG